MEEGRIVIMNEKSNERKINVKWDRDLLIAIVIGVLSGMVVLGMFFLSGYMITQSALGAPLYALMGLIVTVKLFGFLRAITRYFERLYSHRATFTMLRDVRVTMYQALSPIVPDVFRHFKASDLLGRMVTSVETLQNIYLRVYYPPVVISIISLMSMIVFYYISWGHSLIIGVTMLLTLLIMPKLVAYQARLVKQEVNRQQQHLMSHYYNQVQGQHDLRRFNSVALFQQRVEKAEQQLNQAEHREQNFHILYNYILNLVSMIALLMSIILGVYQIKHQVLDPIYMTSIILMVLTLLEQLVAMSQVPYYKGETDLVQKQIEEITKYRHNRGGQTHYQMSHITIGDPLFTLKDVALYYTYRERPILKNIDLTIKKGEHVALVGSSGSGKSTLLHVLMGLYNVSEGTIYAGEKEVNEIDERQYLQQMNILLQDPHYFDGTIKDNLLTEVDDDTCRWALDQVGLSHIGLNRLITMDKTALSGGEFQRLAIARLLIRKASVWLVDEPTNSLDHTRTQMIINLLHEHAETLVVATHDIQYIDRFDRIIEIKEGRIVQDVTPSEFKKRKNGKMDIK